MRCGEKQGPFRRHEVPDRLVAVALTMLYEIAPHQLAHFLVDRPVPSQNVRVGIDICDTLPRRMGKVPDHPCDMDSVLDVDMLQARFRQASLDRSAFVVCLRSLGRMKLGELEE